VRGADDHRDPPVPGSLLVAGEARVEVGGEVPEALPLGAVCLRGPVAPAAALGPELDLRVGQDVVVPGRMFALSAKRGDLDHVIAIVEVCELRSQTLATTFTGVGE
jgi:hypothetical protein